jgi:hypothetical protein
VILGVLIPYQSKLQSDDQGRFFEMSWNHSRVKPPKAGVYCVQVPFPAKDGDLSHVGEHFARWTGTYWCCWATTIDKAWMCEWRGPTAGYMWAPLQG